MKQSLKNPSSTPLRASITAMFAEKHRKLDFTRQKSLAHIDWGIPRQVFVLIRFVDHGNQLDLQDDSQAGKTKQ